MRCYLPAETEVVIEGASGTGYGWFTLMREADVTVYNSAICPLRSALPVLTAVVSGQRIWFLESQVKVELPEEMVANINIQKMVTLEYDVPARVSQHPTNYKDETGRSFQHPSIWMWGIGARTSGSVWILPAERIPYRRIRTLIRAGCNYRVTYIDSTDVANHLQRTVVTLRNEWLAAETAYHECIKSAEDRNTERGDTEASREQMDKDLKRVDRELKKKRENILAGAKLFSVPEEWVCEGKAVFSNGTATVKVNANLGTVRVSGRQLMDNRVEAHCELVDKLKDKGHTALANEVETGKLPHDIAADFAEENEVIDSDGTFSLRELFKDE